MKCTMEIERILEDLKNHRSEFRRVLHHPSLDYCCVAGNEFLIEVRNANLRMVPSDWIKISSTKQVSRFRTQYVEEKFTLLCQWREQLHLASQEAWLEFLTMFSVGCSRYRRAIQYLATIDCLFSLAAVAKQSGFVRPVVTDSTAHIHIKQGRHPVIDSLLSENEQFVPNDTYMNVNSNRCMIITGPNMGGKSSYIKQVALIVILAQVGSYVPAEEAHVGILDAVYTRMGGSDNIYKGRSTFMTELQETSEIISQASEKSLVILDELGRGTSTHDGTAIAWATLHHFITSVRSLSLFVTHYPSLAELENLYPSHVSNNHMAFMTSEDDNRQETIKKEGEAKDAFCTLSVSCVTFLYHLVTGAAARSYGLNVARLAGIPCEILEEAAAKSQELENEIVNWRCPHCQALNPELEAAANFLATKDQYVFAKVDCMGDGKLLCQQFNVQGYPTLKLFKYGQYVGDYVGQRDKNSLMQYVDSVASTYAQHSPLTTSAIKPGTLAQAIEGRPNAQAFTTHQTSPIHSSAQAIVPSYINQVHTQLKNPSLLASFYGSSAQHAPLPNMAAFVNKSPYVHQASPDSLQSKFGNMASLDVYRSKLKMIAAYKNYQRRLREYREKLTAATKGNINRNPQPFAGAITQAPRPGVNPLYGQPQTYRGYYRPEAMAAQNVQINRAVPQAMNPFQQYPSPYGYTAMSSNPYYRSKMGHGGTIPRKPKPEKPQAAEGPNQDKILRERNAAAQYNAKLMKERQRLQQQQQQQQPQDQQQPRQQHQQGVQPADKPAAPSPGQSGQKPDASALKDLKADIESAIQDALRNAAKEGRKTKSNPAVQIGGDRAQAQATAPDQDKKDDGPGIQSRVSNAHGSGVEDAAVNGEGSGSGVKPDS